MMPEKISLIASGASAFAAIISAFAAFATWRVSKRLYGLQNSIEEAKRPLVHIWYDGTKELTPKVTATLTFVNLGSTPLLLRTLRLIAANGQASQIALLPIESKSDKRDRSYTSTSLKYTQELTDLIFNPSVAQHISLQIESSQFKVEAMYYDNSFEFVPIDNSRLGGNYILSGKRAGPTDS